MIIPKGKILTATTGSYSDYRILGHFRALKGFDTDKAAESHLSDGGLLDEDAFLNYLMRKKLIECLDDQAIEIHISAGMYYKDYPVLKETGPRIEVT